MDRTPSINPNDRDIADRAKFGYAKTARSLAVVQYRLAELAGTGQLDAEESSRLQCELSGAYDSLYLGTVGAVRDWNSDDALWDEADNTYSDGTQVKIQIRVEPEDYSDFRWEHNQFLLGDGAVNEYPLGTISQIRLPRSL
jgi:hypothetical protein